MSKNGLQKFVTGSQEVSVRNENARNIFVSYLQKNSVKKTKGFVASLNKNLVPYLHRK